MPVLKKSITEVNWIFIESPQVLNILGNVVLLINKMKDLLKQLAKKSMCSGDLLKSFGETFQKMKTDNDFLQVLLTI